MGLFRHGYLLAPALLESLRGQLDWACDWDAILASWILTGCSRHFPEEKHNEHNNTRYRGCSTRNGSNQNSKTGQTPTYLEYCSVRLFCGGRNAGRPDRESFAECGLRHFGDGGDGSEQ